MCKDLEPCTYEEYLEKKNQLRKEIYKKSFEIQENYEKNDFKGILSSSKDLNDIYHKLNKEEKYLGFPDDITLPFFAYGIFKKGQIAYPRINEYVYGEPLEDVVEHTLYERDGIPFIREDDKKQETSGQIMFFKNPELAYDIIRKTESRKFYRWGTIDNGLFKVNVLFGKKPSRSNPIRAPNSYNGENDVFFQHAMELISKEMKDYEFEDNFDNFFKLQRNYMLLWACIERYTSLKYGENTKTFNNKQLANENIFKKSLKYFVKDTGRKIFNSQNLENVKLDPNNPEKAIEYYYTMRSNVVHRGKSVSDVDEEKLRRSLVELLNIFQCVLKDNFKNINFSKVPIEIGEKIASTK